MKNFVVLCSRFIFLSLFSVSVFAGELPGNIPTAPSTEGSPGLNDKVAHIDLNWGLDLFSVTPVEGFRFRSRYTYKVQPAYRNHSFLRSDSWELRVGLDAGSFLEETGSPFFAGLSANAIVKYHRQFTKQLDAAKALPKFSFKNIPLTSALALKYMTPGTLVEVPLNMNFAFGAQTSDSMGIIAGSASAAYVSSGTFLTQFYRLKNNHVRVRLIAHRSKGTIVEGSLRFFEVLDIKQADSALERLFMKKIVAVTDSRMKGNIFFTDLIFDLNDVEAQKAYDAFFSGGFRLATAKIFNPASNEIDLSKMYVNNFEPVESLAREDLQKPDAQKRVKRVFKAVSDYVATNDALQIGGAIGSRAEYRRRSAHEITAWDAEDNVAEFVLAGASQDSQKRAFWGRIHEGSDYTMSLLFDENSSDPQVREDLSFSDLILSNDRFDRTVRKSELAQLAAQIDRDFPKQIQAELPFGKLWQHSELHNARVFYRTVFHKDFLAVLKKYSEADFRKAFRNYVYDHDGNAAMPELDCFKWGVPMLPNCPVIRAAERMSLLGDWMGRTDLETRDSFDFLKMRKSNLFRKYGQGFLLSLIPAQRVHDLVSFQVDLEALEIAPVTREEKSSRSKNDAIWYDSLETLQNIVSQGGVDLRLLDESFEAASSD